LPPIDGCMAECRSSGEAAEASLVDRPHFRQRHIPGLISGVNSSINNTDTFTLQSFILSVSWSSRSSARHGDNARLTAPANTVTSHSHLKLSVAMDATVLPSSVDIVNHTCLLNELVS